MALAVVNADRGSNTSGSGATSIATAGQNHTGGNLLVVLVRRDTAASVTTDSVTDTAGNTYTRAVFVDRSGDRTEIWYAKNITGNASNVVTANFSGNCAYRVILVVQYSGADTSAPLDATATGTGSLGTVTSGSFTTAQADEVLVACAEIQNLGNTWTPDTGYTNEIEDSPDSVCVYTDKIVAATQTGVTTTITVVNGSANAIVVATFKAAAPASGPIGARVFRIPSFRRGVTCNG